VVEPAGPDPLGTATYEQRPLHSRRRIIWLALFSVVLIGTWLAMERMGVQAMLLAYAERLYSRYGYTVVLLGAFAEGILLINWYLPGSTVVILGAMFCTRGGLDIRWVVACAIAGFLVAYAIDFVAGWYGWYRAAERYGVRAPLLRVKQRLGAGGVWWGMLFYAHPNSGALCATAAGILRLRPHLFALMTIVAVSGWNVFWGGIAYRLGEAAAGLFNGSIIAVLVLVIVVVLAVVKPRVRNHPEARQ
jgi:membrane protein DedA with SNARE-associated domain